MKRKILNCDRPTTLKARISLTVTLMSYARAMGAEREELMCSRLGARLTGCSPAHGLPQNHSTAAASRFGCGGGGRVGALPITENGITEV